MHQYNERQLHNLFLQQSFLDACEEYKRQTSGANAVVWDYVILTSSNEAQAGIYRQEISHRLRDGRLTERSQFLVIPDPEGKRIGSGGATLNVLKEISELESDRDFTKLRILVIHSGGDSKRIPQYSACGKLFSPVPRSLPGGMGSTLFDEFMIATCLIPSRLSGGMLVLSGDVLLLFNALQIDTAFHGAAAISIKEHVEIGQNHGAFLEGDMSNVSKFLHKQTPATLRDLGAVDDGDQVNLDTGAILLGSDLLKALFGLISEGKKVDPILFDTYVNDTVRLSFYGDFLYPLASDVTLEEYQQQAPEGSFGPELTACRKILWEVLSPFSLKLICLSPAQFVHFGTTHELRELMCDHIDDYNFLGWERSIGVSRDERGTYTLYNVFLQDGVKLGDGCYIENSYLSEGSTVGANAVVSGVFLRKAGDYAANTVYHVLKPQDDEESFILRVYGLSDNPKEIAEKGGHFLGNTLAHMAEVLGVDSLWEAGEEHALWTAKLYPVCRTVAECKKYADLLLDIATGKAVDAEQIENWKACKRYSLYSSFRDADGEALIAWREHLEAWIRSEAFVRQMLGGTPVAEALKAFHGDVRAVDRRVLLERAESPETELSERLRIYYGLAMAAGERLGNFESGDEDRYLTACFHALQETISKDAQNSLARLSGIRIAQDEVNVALPVRVNWGGGWTDTPPHCNERGGVVLNAAIRLNGERPIRSKARKLDELVVELESEDTGAHTVIRDMSELSNCDDPFDPFALHKAALIACGVILPGDWRKLEDVLRELGGGIYLSTSVLGVPKGSGLGTSSILSGACVRALFEFFGRNASQEELYEIVLCMEQLMSTGGGWQDQVGGILPGVKMIVSKPGIHQELEVTSVSIPEAAKQELSERFALIYTGQRRLARNLLRDVMGGYIGNRPESLDALEQMRQVAILMQFALQQGNVDEFAALLNRHWDLSIQLDEGSTNTCINQIFLVIEDLIDGKFIAGAGGGGFLQVILKKGVSKAELGERLRSFFRNTGVDVWDCDFLW